MQDWLCNWQWKKKKKSFPLDLSNFLPIPVYLEGAFFTQSGMCIPFWTWGKVSLIFFACVFLTFFLFFFIIVEIFTDKDLVHSRIGSPTILMVLMNQIHCLISVLTYSLLPIIHIFNNLPRPLTMLARQKKRASVLECSLHLITQKITL